VSYKKQELLTLREHQGSPLVFVGVCIAHLLVFCVVFLSFVCLRSVSCVANVASASIWYILDCLFGFLQCLLTFFLIFNYSWGLKYTHIKLAITCYTYLYTAYQFNTLWVWIPFRRGVLDTSLCDKVWHWLEAGRWFSLSNLVSSTNKLTATIKLNYCGKWC